MGAPTRDSPVCEVRPNESASPKALAPFFFGLTGFAQRLFAVLASVFFLLVVWFHLGKTYNIPELIWYENGVFFQISSGFSITLAVGYLWLVTYVVDARCTSIPLEQEVASGKTQAIRSGWLIRWLVPESPYAADPHWSMLTWYLSVTWQPLIFLLAVPVLFDPLNRWPFAIGMALAFLVTRLAVTGLHRLQHHLSQPNQPFPRVAQGLVGDGRWLRALATTVFVGLLVAYAVLSLTVPNHSPPIASLCIMFAFLGGITGAVWFYFPRGGWLVLGAVFGWVVFCNSWPYKLRFPGLEYGKSDRVRLAAYEEPEVIVDENTPLGKQEKQRVIAMYRELAAKLQEGYLGSAVSVSPLNDNASYDSVYRSYRELLEKIRHQEEFWLEAGWVNALRQARGAGSEKPRMAVVAISGGANRSALWAALVLHRLEEELRGPAPAGTAESLFPRHIRVICGASGGMVGASHFVATLDAKGHSNGFDPASIVADHLSPICNHLVFREIPFLFLPVQSYTHDRGQALEDALAETTPNLDLTFAGLCKGEVEGWRPSLIFSPMLVEDGRRLLVSNLQLPYLTASKGRFLIDHGAPPAGISGTGSPGGSVGKPHFYTGQRVLRQNDVEPHLYQDRYSQSAVELFRLFPRAQEHFKLKTAARMNASFPYISPAVDLPTVPGRRVVDAGYYDNFGVNVAAMWIFRHREWINNNTSGIVLIQIRDSASNSLRRHLVKPEEVTTPGLWERLGTGTQWLTGPPAGAASAWGAITSFRNDEQMQILNDLFNQPTKKVEAGRDFFTTVVFERPGEVGMNWYLSEDNKNEILHGFEEKYQVGDNLYWSPDKNPNPNPEALRLLKQWWKNGGA